MKTDGQAEATATGGLFLVFIAIIASALSLGSFAAADGMLAAAAAVVALVSFTGSIVCFCTQSDEPVSGELAAH
jgi:hypothetical protein